MATVFNHRAKFDVQGRTMTVIVHERLHVMFNFGEYEIVILKDDKIIDRASYKGEPFSLRDLELILTQANEAAQRLKEYERRNESN